MKLSARAVDINDSIGTVLGSEAWKGNVDHAGGQGLVVLLGKLVAVDPAFDVTDLEEGAQERVNGDVAEEDLEFGRLSSVLVRHVSEVSGPFGLSNLVVVHDTLGTELEGSVGDNSGLWCLPVEVPVLGAGDQKGSIQSLHLGVEELRDGRRQSISNRVLNKVHDGALEKDLESTGEVRPDVSPDLDVDIVAIDVNDDINGADCWHNLAIGRRLRRERETHTNVDGVHDDFGMASSNEDPRVCTERVRVEVGRQVVHVQSHRVVSRIHCKNHVRCVLAH